MFEASGQATLALWQGTAFDVSYVLEGVALLIIPVVMLRSTLFSKVTASVGILIGGVMLVPPTVGMIGLLFSLGSLVPLEIWLILIARRLFQLGWVGSRVVANQPAQASASELASRTACASRQAQENILWRTENEQALSLYQHLQYVVTRETFLYNHPHVRLVKRLENG